MSIASWKCQPSPDSLRCPEVPFVDITIDPSRTPFADRDMSLMPTYESVMFLSNLRQRRDRRREYAGARRHITVSEVSRPLSSAVSTRTIASK
jgi:hypothetical protein